MDSKRYKGCNSPRKVDITPETMACSFIEAFNNRDCNPSSPAWAAMSPLFKASISSLRVYEAHLDLESFCAWSQRQISQNPEFRIMILDANTTMNQDGDRASVYLNTRLTGMLKGISMPHIVVWDFRRYGDEWRCVRQSGFSAGVEVGDRGYFPNEVPCL